MAAERCTHSGRDAVRETERTSARLRPTHVAPFSSFLCRKFHPQGHRPLGPPWGRACSAGLRPSIRPRLPRDRRLERRPSTPGPPMTVPARGGTAARSPAQMPPGSSSIPSSASGRDVGEGSRWFRRDRFLADAKMDRGVRRDAEHHVRCIVREGPAVPFGEAENRGRANFIRKDIWEEPTGH